MNNIINLPQDTLKTAIYFNPKKFNDDKIIDIINTLHKVQQTIKIFPQNINKEYNTIYDIIIQNIIVDMKKDKLCNNIIKEYINESIEDIDAILKISYLNDNNRNYGFALLHFYQSTIYDLYIFPNTIYIDLLCANKSIDIIGIGNQLLNCIKQIMINIEYQQIELEPIDNVVLFYEKNGFVKNNTSILNSSHMIFNTTKLNLTKQYAGKKRKTKRRLH